MTAVVMHKTIGITNCLDMATEQNMENIYIQVGICKCQRHESQVEDDKLPLKGIEVD